MVTRLIDKGLFPARRCWEKNLSSIHVVLSSIKASLPDALLAYSWNRWERGKICDSCMAEVFSPTACTLTGSFEVTWKLTSMLFQVKSLQEDNIDSLSVKYFCFQFFCMFLQFVYTSFSCWTIIKLLVVSKLLTKLYISSVENNRYCAEFSF